MFYSWSPDIQRIFTLRIQRREYIILGSLRRAEERNEFEYNWRKSPAYLRWIYFSIISERGKKIFFSVRKLRLEILMNMFMFLFGVVLDFLASVSYVFFRLFFPAFCSYTFNFAGFFFLFFFPLSCYYFLFYI